MISSEASGSCCITEASRDLSWAIVTSRELVRAKA